jgi:hypothetical protein
VVDPDYFFVWSDHMKNELLRYYPYIKEKKIYITGTPQFEPHFLSEFQISKEEFYKTYSLDPEKEYLCFSGDDITTSPHDEIYLKDIVQAVREMNKGGEKLGVIFRKNPADFSGRYKAIINEYADVIISIDPLWELQGDKWNHLMPTKADSKLLSQIIQHSFMVINIGSSMVFDYCIYQKPCAYINYNPENIWLKKDIKEIYNYVHFRSIPSEKAVLWINSRSEIKEKINLALQGKVTKNIEEANAWFTKINLAPPKIASERIWMALENILEKQTAI